MSSGVNALQRFVGAQVESVTLNIVFYGADQRGDLGEGSLHLSDGQIFRFGCAGDGSVLVVSSEEPLGQAPGTEIIVRTVTNAKGLLEHVEVEESSVRLRVGGRELRFVNMDDELEVEVDGATIPEDYFGRSPLSANIG